MLYKEWLETWLENYVKPSNKSRTYTRYAELVRQHLGGVGDYELGELTPLVLQQCVMTLLQSGNLKTRQGLSANSVNTIISVMQSSLKTAYTLGFIPENVGSKIQRPKISEKQVECFTVAEQKQIEQFILTSKKKKLYGVVLCLYTGLRIGELLALKWCDIDLGKGLLRVNHTCYDTKGGRVDDTPKTKTSVRVIPIPKQIMPLCKELKKSSRADYVLTDHDQIIAVRSYQRSFELLLKRLNITHKGFHALRHTFATRALECGMDVKTLSEILGHKNSQITLNRYAHSLMDHKIDVMNKLGKLLQNQPNKKATK